MSLTDRIGNGPYTAEDGAAISVLMALAALALDASVCSARRRRMRRPR